MPSPRAKILFSVPVLVGSLAALALATSGWPADGPGPVERDVGRALARETLRLAAPGGRVVVVARDPSAFRAPADEAVLDALEHELRKGGATVAQRQLYSVDPLRPPQVPAGDFFEILRRAAAGDVVVSLLGPPLLADEQRAALGTPKAKVVAFCPGTMGDYINLPLLAESGLLHGGVFARSFKPSTDAARPADTFDALYTAGLPAAARRP